MAKLGDKIELHKQTVEVVKCERCEDLMVNIDANELQLGDLTILKSEGVKISNPETDDPICINCEYRTFGRKLADWFDTTTEDDDDDSSFFSSRPSSSGSLFGGSIGLGGFGGGFGGFGGGGFGGGGAARGF